MRLPKRIRTHQCRPKRVVARCFPSCRGGAASSNDGPLAGLSAIPRHGACVVILRFVVGEAPGRFVRLEVHRHALQRCPPLPTLFGIPLPSRTRCVPRRGGSLATERGCARAGDVRLINQACLRRRDCSASAPAPTILPAKIRGGSTDFALHPECSARRSGTDFGARAQEHGLDLIFQLVK
jgi:hypothetical protein